MTMIAVGTIRRLSMGQTLGLQGRKGTHVSDRTEKIE